MSELRRGDGPIFSILVPVWRPDPEHLRACLRSVVEQTTDSWELCLVVDGPQPPAVDGQLIATIDEFFEPNDPRLRLFRRPENGGISAATDDALDLATGEFVALLDQDDTLAPDALGTMAWEIDAAEDVDLVFSDEDHLSEQGERVAPFFKPGFSIERLRQQMYLGHLVVCRRSLALEVGGFRAGFDGAQDHDLALRVAERARRVLHIPKLLYHWRESPTSTALDPKAKDWAYEAGVRAVAAHLERTRFPARAVRNPDWPGIIDLEPELAEHPPVSIVMPTGGAHRVVRGVELLLARNAIESIVAETTYPDYEIVLVLDRHSTDDLAAELVAAAGQARIRVVRDGRDFNFAKASNLGAVRAEGDVVLFLNDDTEASTPDWLHRLVMYATRPDIGAVGPKLLYGDRTIQQAGIWARDGNPGHRYVGYPADHPGYLASLASAQNCLAVTAACLAVERHKFFEVGGFATQFPLSYNDVDLCLKLNRSGYRSVLDCATEVIHHESSSRDPTVSDWEFERLQRRWSPILAQDPYYNPNHTADGVEEWPPTSALLTDLRDRMDDVDHRARAWPALHEHQRC